MYPRQSLTPRCSAKPTRRPAHGDDTPRGFKEAAGADAEDDDVGACVIHTLSLILMQMYTFAPLKRAQTAQPPRTSLCLRRC